LSVVKTREREAAIALRQEGRSIREITRLVGVSKSSISLWVRDVELTPQQHDALRARNAAYDRQRLGNKVWSALCRDRRLNWQAEGRLLARGGDPLFAAGCMLYWAEGSKTRNVVQMTNSDPEVLRFFVDFLRKYFHVCDERFAVTCNLFADHLSRQQEVERFWLTTLRLPHSCLKKSIVNRYSKYSQKKRQNMLPWGTARVSVGRTQVVQTIYGAIQEYGGFDRPEWLD
jgi:AcrR family transcriptional regulator